MTPLQNLPMVRCRDEHCGWIRRALPDVEPGKTHPLILAGRAHMTETDGHQVELVEPTA